MREAQGLEAQGVRELVLISQDTTRYGEDLGLGRTGLTELVRALLAETSFPWIRFLYAYPKTLDPGIFELMAREKRFVPYVDMPLQHVSRKILSSMKRGGDGRTYAGNSKRSEKRPGDRLRIDVHRRISGRREARVPGDLRVRPRCRVRQSRRLHLLARARLGLRGAGRPGPGRGENRAPRFSLMASAADRSNEEPGDARQVLETIVEGPFEETDDLLEGRLAAQAPEIDGRLLVNERGRGFRPVG